ncbi:MAG: hypothetical protein CHACPFDD_00854 [Phycisphaerae bacterium]|nr:hypothetical protein [Phycisphaerae bacterium]
MTSKANKMTATCRSAPPGDPVRDGPPGAFPPLLDAAERAAVARPCGLTPREVEVLTALTRGLSDAAVAVELGVGLETARKHRQAVLRKCGCTSRLRLVLWLVHDVLLSQRSRDGWPARRSTP